MSDYMLISSRDPFEYGDADNLYRAATVLRTAGHDVTLFLVQNSPVVSVPTTGPFAT